MAERAAGPQGTSPGRARGSRLVALIVPGLTKPIAFARAVDDGLAQHGYTLVLCTPTPGGATEDDFVDVLLDRGVTGLVFVAGRHADSTADHGRYRQLAGRGLPLVLVNGFLPDLDATFLSTDDELAMDMAVQHLAALGHTTLGLVVGPRRLLQARGQALGFTRAVSARLGAAPDPATALVEHSALSVAAGQQAADRLLDRGATALLCGSDLVALGAVRAARCRGLSVPEDFSVVGYDDSAVTAFVDPPLTVVRPPAPAMGAAAVTALLDQISGVRLTGREYVFRPELVVRGSTARLRRGA
ncbi:MAG TPA: substrate-binding domain-containing protein [Actinomycetes bacterium]